MVSLQKDASASAKKRVVPHASIPHTFNRIYLGGVHVLSVVAILYMAFWHFSWETVFFSFVLYHFAAFGITAGSHRLWAHRSYNASPALRLLLVIMNLVTNQGSIYKWVRDHRLHHAHVDTEKDPHNASLGFWWSHCGWLMYAKSTVVTDAGKQVYMDDIKADKFVMWQARNYKWASPIFCFLIPTLIASLWGDAMGGYLVGGALRYCLELHATWFVNSLAHLWGYRPYMPNIMPVENLFVAVCANGEGWHNYHHAYPYDYSTNEYGFLQYNPTTLFINICAFLGLVKDRRRANLHKDDSVLSEDKLPIMSIADVDTLAQQQGAVMIIDKIVYDLSQFEDNHPAGASILKDWYGKDATKAFNGEAHNHTEVARNMMKAYRIARIA